MTRHFSDRNNNNKKPTKNEGWTLENLLRKYLYVIHTLLYWLPNKTIVLTYNTDTDLKSVTFGSFYDMLLVMWQ